MFGYATQATSFHPQGAVREGELKEAELGKFKKPKEAKQQQTDIAQHACQMVFISPKEISN